MRLPALHRPTEYTEVDAMRPQVARDGEAVGARTYDCDFDEQTSPLDGLRERRMTVLVILGSFSLMKGFGRFL